MPLQNVANDNDNVVLNEAESLSNGGIWEKIRAFDSLIKSFWTLPRKECEELLIKLAKNNQPTDVRLHVALRLLKGVQIDKNTYEALMNTLLNPNEPL